MAFRKGPWSSIARVLVPIVALTLAVRSSAGQPPVDSDPSPFSQIFVGAEYSGTQPGSRLTAAIRVTLDKGWHTYWLNGGDAGFPLTVEWTLPPGASASALRWPAPELIPTSGLMSYGFHDELVLLFDVTAPRARGLGATLVIAGAVSWLVCADVCLPAQENIHLRLPLSERASQRDPEWDGIIGAARERLPSTLDVNRSRAWKGDKEYVLGIELPDSVATPEPYFFVDSSETLEHAAPQRVWRRNGWLYLSLPKSEFALSDPGNLRGVLAARAGRGDAARWWISVSVEDNPPPPPLEWMPESQDVVQETGGAGGSLTQDSGSGGAPLSLPLAIAFAFAGGLLLNLMPCVFPVLSLKVLGFLEHGAHDASRARQHGMAFAAGVVLSFWVLSALLLLLRAGGESVGWGFQLQSPVAVAAFAVVLFGLALNMSGLFEMGLSLTRLGAVGSGGSLRDSALTGALAVIVAAPCTAPFMGAALGFAVTQPAAIGMAVFTSLAIGLAAPYVVLASSPRLLRRLPRPGAWMITLKQFLAYPIYGTVVWLVWVYGRQVGVDAVAMLLLTFVFVAMAAWLWGRNQVKPSRYAAMAAISLLLLAGTLAVVAPRSANGAAQVSGVDEWEVFSPARLAQLRAEGRPVFVDFTAAWCLSCQVNERVALHNSQTRAAFAAANVALLRADWTSRDSTIAAVLQSFGRTGVPLYVLYPANPRGTPEILPAVLLPSTIVRAVERASKAAAVGRENTL